MKTYSSRNTTLLTVLVCCFSLQLASAADVAVREHATLTGPIVRLGDVADITAGSAATLKNLASTPLIPAPAPGTTQFLERSQIRDLLATRGVNIQDLHFGGQPVVEIGKQPKQPETEAGQATLVLTDLEIEAALHQAIEQYLQSQTGHDQWRIELQLGKADIREVGQLGAVLDVQGGRDPWTGRQQFRVGSTALNEKVSVNATIAKVQAVVFCRQPIKKGDIIRATDVEVRQHEGRVPSDTLVSLDQVVGMEARRSISPNSIMQENQVQAPIQVQRGETVKVVARTGGISVRTYVVARQDGAVGDLVQVETLDGKQRFAARVAGHRRLEILASGIQAGDFATLGGNTLQR
ncbi:MAG: flagellar basal body P-ring formation protein FlgA [Planctomycetales bacterium]|nr:flagellar basal body P-ring formation protein FlgA [Planctomycetales bacterium]